MVQDLSLARKTDSRSLNNTYLNIFDKFNKIKRKNERNNIKILWKIFNKS